VAEAASVRRIVSDSDDDGASDSPGRGDMLGDSESKSSSLPDSIPLEEPAPRRRAEAAARPAAAEARAALAPRERHATSGGAGDTPPPPLSSSPPPPVMAPADRSGDFSNSDDDSDSDSDGDGAPAAARNGLLGASGGRGLAPPSVAAATTAAASLAVYAPAAAGGPWAVRLHLVEAWDIPRRPAAGGGKGCVGAGGPAAVRLRGHYVLGVAAAYGGGPERARRLHEALELSPSPAGRRRAECRGQAGGACRSLSFRFKSPRPPGPVKPRRVGGLRGG
jgi:hypothetical protein